MSKTGTPKSRTARKPRASKKVPTHEQIALRAYHIYLERNCAPGNPHEDWLRAERELAEVIAKPKPRRKKATVTPIAA